VAKAVENQRVFSFSGLKEGVVMAATRFPFTMERLRTLPPPSTDRATYHDSTTAGLILRITINGVKSFYRYGRVQGRPTRVLLGTFPAMSVDDARKACTAATAKIDQGRDPHAERIAQRREHTLAALWEHWWAHALAHKKPKSQLNDRHLWESFLKPWQSRRLTSIHQADVRALHSKVGRENGPYAANRVLSLLGAMYVKAREIGFEGEKPTRGVVRFSEKSRDRFLRPDELEAFFKALHSSAVTETMRDFFFVALLSGQRRSNVEGMRWRDVSFELALWRIPGAFTKEGNPIVAPLSAPALEILKRRRKADPTGQWVFPSRSKAGHVTEPKGAWKRLLAEAGLSDVRLHDLRRTLGSWQALGGSSLQVIGQSLGHGDLRSTQVYSRLTLDPVRESINAATAAMLAYQVNPAAHGAADAINAEVAADDDEPTEF
jgi:integrase